MIGAENAPILNHDNTIESMMNPLRMMDQNEATTWFAKTQHFREFGQMG